MKFCRPCWRLDYFIISSFICQHLFYLFFASFLLCHTILYTYFFEACFSIPFLSTLRQAPFCINFLILLQLFTWHTAYCRYHHLIAIFKVVLTTIQLYTEATEAIKYIGISRRYTFLCWRLFQLKEHPLCRYAKTIYIFFLIWAMHC